MPCSILGIGVMAEVWRVLGCVQSRGMCWWWWSGCSCTSSSSFVGNPYLLGRVGSEALIKCFPAGLGVLQVLFTLRMALSIGAAFRASR